MVGEYGGSIEYKYSANKSNYMRLGWGSLAFFAFAVLTFLDPQFTGVATVIMASVGIGMLIGAFYFKRQMTREDRYDYLVFKPGFEH